MPITKLIGAVSLPSLEYLYRSVPLISWQIPHRRASQFSISPHCTAAHKQLLSHLSARRSVAYSKALWSMCNLYTNPTAPCEGSYLFSGIDNHHLLKSFFLNTLLLEGHQSSPTLILPRAMARKPVILLSGAHVFLNPSGYFWSPWYVSKICRVLAAGVGVTQQQSTASRSLFYLPQSWWNLSPCLPFALHYGVEGSNLLDLTLSLPFFSCTS